MNLLERCVPMAIKSFTEAMSIAHCSDHSLFSNSAASGESGNPLTPGIQLSAAYYFDSIQSLQQYHENKYAGQRYGRDSNDVCMRLEKYFDVIYPSMKSMIFSSGMSAVSTVLNMLTKNGTTMFCPLEYYRKTVSYISHLQKKIELTVELYENIDDIINSKFSTKDNIILIIESPSNPHLRLVDYDKIKDLKKVIPSMRVVVDLTFAGLFNCNLEDNLADVIIHSCTKYINGHNDVLAGLAIVNEELYAPLWDIRSMTGGLLDGMSGFLLLRSLRTYDMRMEQHLRNTEEILKLLEVHPAVDRIYYPGRYSNCDQHEIFNNYHTHGGAVISFTSHIPLQQLAERFSDFKCIKNAPSFGSIDTLIEIPSIMSYHGKPDHFFHEIGLEKDLIRLSVGCEPVSFIWNDLEYLLCQ